MIRYSRSIVAALAVTVAGAILAPSISAQTDYSNRRATSFLSIGPGFAGGASLAVDPPTGYKVGPVFSWRGTAEVAYPLSPSISAMMSLGYDSRGTAIEDANGTSLYDTRTGYFSIQPGFVFSGFYIGMNFGFPMSGSVTTPDGTTTSFTDAQLETVESVLEPRLGGVFTLINDKSGWLAMTVTGGYDLNEAKDPNGAVSFGKMVSAHLGVFYQFTIPGTGKR